MRPGDEMGMGHVHEEWLTAAAGSGLRKLAAVWFTIGHCTDSTAGCDSQVTVSNLSYARCKMQKSRGERLSTIRWGQGRTVTELEGARVWKVYFRTNVSLRNIRVKMGGRTLRHMALYNKFCWETRVFWNSRTCKVKSSRPSTSEHSYL